MKNMLTPSCNLAVSLLLGFWGCASAQSLGTPSGEILLGRPLEITVPARFTQIDGDECVHADVFYGDSRLKAGQVRSSVTGPEGQRRIRIETSHPVDEPVVTVSVRAGCRNTITRNYTLLPEYPSETLLAAIAARSAASPVAAAPGPLQLAASTAPVQRPSVVRAARAPSVAQAAADATPPARSTRNARAARQETVARGPRLKLEPLELLEPEAQTLLRVSHNLANPDGDAARRATAALLWKAINADPQELLRTTAMLQKLESDLAQLRQSSAQTRAEVLALRQRLERAQPWYASAPLLQGLLLLVLAAATAAGVLWYRTRRFVAGGEPWYVQGTEPAPAPAVTEAQELTEEVPAQQPVAVERREATPLPAAAAAVAAGMGPAAAAAPSRGIDFELPPREAAVRRGTDGVLRVEALAATFEEVAFLSSLGLAADAMDVLKAYLQDSVSPAPIAFFELMRLCDEADDAAAVATVRRRYAQAFGCEAPPLEQLMRPLGLESNTELSARITSAWGTGDAPALIEDSLFNVPAPGTVPTLQAGRDLLSLYDLAVARAAEAGAPAAGHEADAHPLAPWAAAEDHGAAQLMVQAIADAQGGHRFALDVDLGAAPAPLPDPQEVEVAPLLADLKAAALREQAERARAEQEDAFSAAVASERMPVSRF